MVSVIVCTFNREAVLPGALESLGRQTADPASYEIVIVNNNSTDGTDRLCRNFVETHPELNTAYFTELHTGLSHARNRGMAEANGRFLTYIDDDAIATPDFVEKISAFFRGHEDAAAVGGKVLAIFAGDRPGWFNRFSASALFSHYDRGNDLFRFTRRAGYPIGCNMTFRAEVLRQAGGFDTALGRREKVALGWEETELFSRLFAEDVPFYYDPAQVVFHRIDRSRTERPYLRRLALGSGQTQRTMYCKSAFSFRCIWQVLLTLMKLATAAGLAVLYLARGRPEVSRHLLWFRWTVLKGMFVGR